MTISRIFAKWPAPSALWHLPLLAVAVAAVYLHTLDVPFYLDDFSSIQENPLLYQQQGLAAWWRYAPLRIVGYLSFALNYALHQFDTAGYHLFNILLHFLAGCALYGLARAILNTPALAHGEATLRDWLPLLAALLFVLHPLHTQAVTYIVQRLAVLAALFYLAALAAYLQARLADTGKRRWQWGSACAVLALLGFFTKQNTATLPLALLLAEWLLLRSPPRLVLKVAGLALSGLLLFWLLLAGIFQYAPFSLEAMESLTRDTDKISRGAYLATQSVVLWEYIRLFFWPAGLHIDYDWRPLASFGESLPWLAGHLLLIGLAMASARRWPLAAFAVLFYYLAHSVESGLIPIRDVIFEHRAYLPDAGLCLLTAWLALRLLGWLKRREAAAALGASRTELRVSRKKRKKPMPLPVNPPRPAIPIHALARAAMLAGLVAILLGLAAATWQRNQLWRDPIRLWQDNVAKAPDKARAWGILGKHWLQAGQPEQGVAALERALRLQQRQMGRISILDVNNLVVGLKQLQRYERALEVIAYMLAQPMEPMLRAKFAINRANIFIERKRLAEAEWVYRHVLKNIYPPSILARANLANLLGSTGRLDEAEQLYREVLAIDPGNPVFQDNLRRLQAARQQSLSTPGKPVLAPVPDGE